MEGYCYSHSWRRKKARYEVKWANGRKTIQANRGLAKCTLAGGNSSRMAPSGGSEDPENASDDSSDSVPSSVKGGIDLDSPEWEFKG